LNTKELKFRITYQHEDTGRFVQRIIELGEAFPYLAEKWFIVGKDQYIGLKDKSGNKIYDGDIVYIYGSEFNDIPMSKRTKQKVVWAEPCYAFVNMDVDINTTCCISTYITGRDMEIIGSIYENPELFD